MTETNETQAPEAQAAAPQAAAPQAPQGKGGRGRGPGKGGQGHGGGRGPGGDRGQGGDRNRGPRRERERQPGEEDGVEYVEKLVAINRVAKVVKGGKRFGFAAIVIVGDAKGRAGHGTGKAREVPEAIAKATAAARRNMQRIPLREGRTIHHDVRGIFGAGKVVLRTAPSGTGIIAGGPMRAVFEALGVQDVVAKSVGTSNPHNMIKATFEALKASQSPRTVAARRSKKVSDILGKQAKEYASEAAEG